MTYTTDYDSPDIRSHQYSSLDILMPYLKSNMNAVDLGCGTCRKTVEIAKRVKHIDCVDNNMCMLHKARQNIQAKQIRNIRLFFGDNLNLPFQSYSYDLCVSILTTWSPAEAHRLLHKDGLLFLEALDADDKVDLKRAFGHDEYGWRGRFLNQTSTDRLYYITLSLSPFFDIITMRNIEFTTTLSKMGLIKLLSTTPTIRDFSLEKDKSILDCVTSQGSVTLLEKRIVIIASVKDRGESNYAKSENE